MRGRQEHLQGDNIHLISSCLWGMCKGLHKGKTNSLSRSHRADLPAPAFKSEWTTRSWWTTSTRQKLQWRMSNVKIEKKLATLLSPKLVFQSWIKSSIHQEVKHCQRVQRVFQTFPQHPATYKLWIHPIPISSLVTQHPATSSDSIIITTIEVTGWKSQLLKETGVWSPRRWRDPHLHSLQHLLPQGLRCILEITRGMWNWRCEQSLPNRHGLHTILYIYICSNNNNSI